MKPAFRNDLVCSREEQQGVVFYRIDDPKAQTSFRLYEIEYLIAKKLDGVRGLAEVIGAVKKEFNFDITEPDLQRFVNQLESMGFLVVRRDTADKAAVDAEPETAVMERPGGPPPAKIDLAVPQEGRGSGEVDQAEFNRLLRSAFLHVKQGYVVHARDYFLAAKEINPGDNRLVKLVHHLEIIGDASGPAEVEYLWNQASQLFPDVAAEVGPMVESRSGGPAPAGVTTPSMQASGWDEDLRARMAWTAVLLVVLFGGVGGLIWVVRTYRIFEAAPKVRVATLRAERIPVLYEEPASQVGATQEAWLSVASDGTVATAAVSSGARVREGDILLALDLPETVTDQIESTKTNLKRLEAAQDKATEKLEKLLAEREAIENERQAAEDKLKELRPKSVLNQGGVSKRDLEKWKTVMVEANKKLSKLKQKERGPRKNVAKVESRKEAAAKRLAAVESRVAAKLIRAPFAGIVTEVRAKSGQSVKTGEKLILLRDAAGVLLSFAVPGTVPVQVGGEAHVAVNRGKPGRGKVARITPGGKGTMVEVKLEDPTGGYLEMKPADFRLVREFADPAFRVPLAAVVDGERSAYVLVVLQSRALERAVMVLYRDAVSAVVRDASGALRDGEQVVAGRLEDGAVADIADGSALEIVEK